MYLHHMLHVQYIHSFPSQAVSIVLMTIPGQVWCECVRTARSDSSMSPPADESSATDRQPAAELPPQLPIACQDQACVTVLWRMFNDMAQSGYAGTSKGRHLKGQFIITLAITNDKKFPKKARFQSNKSVTFVQDLTHMREDNKSVQPFSELQNERLRQRTEKITLTVKSRIMLITFSSLCLVIF